MTQPAAETRHKPTDWWSVAMDVQAFAIRGRDMYETLVQSGHRRPSEQDQRRIASLFKAAELPDWAHQKQETRR